MSYTPTEWEPTDVVTATRMNALEQAVGDMNMSYTPNTWSDGDILSAEKMNALEQAVASSGGGSSDFSTAQVTMNGGLELTNGMAFIDSNKIETGNYFEDVTLEAVLYNGELEIEVMDASNITTSGNISEFVFEFLGYKATITGDCTITVS